MQPISFGRTPSGARMQRMQQSPNYRDGAFQNLSHTPQFTGDTNMAKVMWEFITERNPRSQPGVPIPSVKINLKALPITQNVLVWFGHSSYFIQADGRRFLVDPVLSGAASPVAFTTRSFPGSDAYDVEDLPDIDYLLLTHDHWDHLDYATVSALRPRVGKVITGLGTGAHLERWGFDMGRVLEGDWYDNFALEDGFSIHLTPARHFSGRWLRRNQVLWTGFALFTPSHKLYLGGDSGYDTHFSEVRKRLGDFDLALLECGQYNPSWKFIHMAPEETVQAAFDLGARRMMPVHWAKFALSKHDWDDPIRRASAAAVQRGLPLVTPMIGQPVDLRTPREDYAAWWEYVG